jgi:tetratricopeptide (TPR) repeat protein
MNLKKSKRPLQIKADRRSRSNQNSSAAIHGISWQLTLLVSIAIATATWVIFWPATQNQFVNFDDNLYVTENPQVRRGLTMQGLAWAMTSMTASNWHPITWFSHMLDVTVWGVSPSSAFGHHLTSILLHGVNAALVFLVGLKLFGRWSSALLLAVLLAWHPLRVESVAWIAERKDLLSALFWYASILCYFRYAQQPGSWGRYILVLLLFVAGLMSKPMVITLPCVLLLLDFWPLRRMTWDKPLPTWSTVVPLLKEKLPMFALAAASAVITYVAQLQGGSVVTDQISVLARCMNAIVSYWVYMQQSIWPVSLAVFYPLSPTGPPMVLASLATILVVAATTICIMGRNRYSWAVVGWLYYVGTLVPVIGFVQVGGQSHADRYTYLSVLGLAIILLGLFEVASAKWPKWRPLMLSILGLSIMASAIATRAQLFYWQDSITLFSRATQVSPDSATAWANLGAAYLSSGRIADAIEAYRVSSRLGTSTPAQAGLATALAGSGDFPAAIEVFRQLLEAEPDNFKVANNLAWILATCPKADLRDPDQAVQIGLQANQQSGQRDPSIQDTLAAAYASSGQFDLAVQTAQQAIDLALELQDTTLASSIQSRRKLYQAQRAYIDK